MHSILLVGLGLLLAACEGEGEPDAPAPPPPECRVVQTPAPLPLVLDEVSGVAPGRRQPGVFWMHNDSGGEPAVFALDAAGRLLGRVRVAGAQNRDWEDVAVGACAAGTCLYVADIGDNAAAQPEVHVYRVPEPAVGDSLTAPAQRLRLRYPGGPRDAEALFVLPSGVFVLTKGRNSPVELYRLPDGARPEQPAVLERVRAFGTNVEPLFDQITGASASPDGRTVAVRSYRTLYLYRAAELTSAAAVEPFRFDLSGLGELQGEGVALLDDGTVLLTSEGGPGGLPPTLAVLRCSGLR